MGTEIVEIQGRYENSDTTGNYKHGIQPEYETSTLHVKRFWGGTANGTMVQLTVSGDGISYIQLNKGQIKELIGALMEGL